MSKKVTSTKIANKIKNKKVWHITDSLVSDQDGHFKPIKAYTPTGTRRELILGVLLIG